VTGAGHPNAGRLATRLLTLAGAILLDRLVGEPPAAIHPVVWIGRFADRWLRCPPVGKPSAEFACGAALLATTLGVAAGTGSVAGRLADRLPLPFRLPIAAALLKPAFASRELLLAAERVRRPLDDGDLAAARASLAELVSRDPSALDAPLIAAAAIQSLAENANDSVVAPWLVFLAAGLPGAYAYRAANTLDAMVGYRGRYEFLGKPAARFDDLLNLIPARATAVGIAAAAGPVRGRRALAVARRDHAATPSPNGGWPMAAMAGALGVRLAKVGHYALGTGGREPSAGDIGAAQRLVARLVAAAAAACVLLGFALRDRSRPGEAP